jgi:hypothetical protein
VFVNWGHRALGKSVDFNVDIGQQERHNVHFHFNQLVGNLWIKVDGEPVVRDFRMFSNSLTKRYDLVVGDAEKHDVAIAKTRKRLIGGARKQTYQVFVDGQLLEEH